MASPLALHRLISYVCAILLLALPAYSAPSPSIDYLASSLSTGNYPTQRPVGNMAVEQAGYRSVAYYVVSIQSEFLQQRAY